MKKIKSIFSKYELRFLSQKRPDLVPLNLPSRNDAQLLTEPSIDQIIVQFLKQYDVKVKPRSVGEFNGWDALSALTTFYSANEKNSSFNVASSILMANRSNQVNSAAQDWGTWKRWALDHKNFEQFKGDVIKNISLHNENATKEVEEAIKKAELNNKKIFAILEEPDAKQFIAQQKELVNQKKALISFYSSILLIIAFFLIVLFAFLSGFGVLKKENFEVLNTFFSYVGSASLITAFFTGIQVIFTKSKKRNLGIIGTIISTAFMIILLLQ